MIIFVSVINPSFMKGKIVVFFVFVWYCNSLALLLALRSTGQDYTDICGTEGLSDLYLW